MYSFWVHIAKFLHLWVQIFVYVYSQISLIFNLNLRVQIAYFLDSRVQTISYVYLWVKNKAMCTCEWKKSSKCTNLFPRPYYTGGAMTKCLSIKSNCQSKDRFEWNRKKLQLKAEYSHECSQRLCTGLRTGLCTGLYTVLFPWGNPSLVQDSAWSVDPC